MSEQITGSLGEAGWVVTDMGDDYSPQEGLQDGRGYILQSDAEGLNASAALVYPDHGRVPSDKLELSGYVRDASSQVVAIVGGHVRSRFLYDTDAIRAIVSLAATVDPTEQRIRKLEKLLNGPAGD